MYLTIDGKSPPPANPRTNSLYGFSHFIATNLRPDSVLTFIDMEGTGYVPTYHDLIALARVYYPNFKPLPPHGCVDNPEVKAAVAQLCGKKPVPHCFSNIDVFNIPMLAGRQHQSLGKWRSAEKLAEWYNTPVAFDFETSGLLKSFDINAVRSITDPLASYRSSDVVNTMRAVERMMLIPRRREVFMVDSWPSNLHTPSDFASQQCGGKTTAAMAIMERLKMPVVMFNKRKPS